MCGLVKVLRGGQAHEARLGKGEERGLRAHEHLLDAIRMVDRKRGQQARVSYGHCTLVLAHMASGNEICVLAYTSLEVKKDDANNFGWELANPRDGVMQRVEV